MATIPIIDIKLLAGGDLVMIPPLMTAFVFPMVGPILPLIASIASITVPFIAIMMPIAMIVMSTTGPRRWVGPGNTQVQAQGKATQGGQPQRIRKIFVHTHPLYRQD
jgi:hypothetical protein